MVEDAAHCVKAEQREGGVGEVVVCLSDGDKLDVGQSWNVTLMTGDVIDETSVMESAGDWRLRIRT